MGNNGVWELKKNFALIELIERIQNQENSQAFSSTFLEKEREVTNRFCSYFFPNGPSPPPFMP